MVEPRSAILQGTLDLMVLKTLEQMGPLHGYGIARRIEQVGGQAVIVNQGTIYLCLVRLLLTIIVISRDIVIVAVVAIISFAIGPRTFQPSVWGKLATATYIVTSVVVMYYNFRQEQAVIVNQGTIYLCLVRLLQKRWISAKWGTSENNRKAKFYAITKAGRAQLKAETENWERISGVIGRVLQPESGLPAEASAKAGS